MGELLEEIERTTGIVFEPMPGDKHFACKTEEEPGGYAVDLHLHRNGEEICLAHRLDFPLLDGDVVVAGTLAC